jgi:hypothetical protein
MGSPDSRLALPSSCDGLVIELVASDFQEHKRAVGVVVDGSQVIWWPDVVCTKLARIADGK